MKITESDRESTILAFMRENGVDFRKKEGSEYDYYEIFWTLYTSKKDRQIGYSYENFWEICLYEDSYAEHLNFLKVLENSVKIQLNEYGFEFVVTLRKRPEPKNLFQKIFWKLFNFVDEE